MIDFHFADLAKVVLTFLLALSQPSAKIASAHAAMLNSGDKISGMTLTKGAADARPLWLFCSSEVNHHLTTANCRVPQVPTLAIGHVFLARDEVLADTDWSDLTWNLSVDDQLVNLNDFGTYDYVLPTMTPNPSLVREVFMKFKAWDVVLTNLQPGAHTIKGEVRSDSEQYEWIVKVVIEDSSTSAGQPSKGEPSRLANPNAPKMLKGYLISSIRAGWLDELEDID